MRSSSARAVFGWSAVVINLVLAGVLIVVAVGASGLGAVARIAAGLAGVAFVGLAAGVQRVYLSEPSALRGVHLRGVDGSPAVVVRLRPDTIVFGFATLCALTLALAAGAVAMSGRSTGAAVVLGLLALVFGVLAVDLVRPVRRQAQLVLSPTSIVLHGWRVDGRLDWDDVAATGIVAARNGFELIVAGRQPAPSWQWAALRGLLPATQRPSRPELTVPTYAVDADVQQLAAEIDRYAADPVARLELGTEAGVRRLGGVPG